MIRSDIEKTLASKLDDSQLTVAALRIGSEFDEKLIRRDEMRAGAAVAAAVATGIKPALPGLSMRASFGERGHLEKYWIFPKRQRDQNL